MSIRTVIESIEREMFERATNRNCGNCKWWADNEVCVNGESEEVADFTDREHLCKNHKYIGEK